MRRYDTIAHSWQGGELDRVVRWGVGTGIFDGVGGGGGAFTEAGAHFYLCFGRDLMWFLGVFWVWFGFGVCLGERKIWREEEGGVCRVEGR